MADEPRVIIRHPDGREYSIPADAFDRDLGYEAGSYKEQGFEMVGREHDAEAANAELERQLKADAAEAEKAARAQARENAKAQREAAKPEAKSDAKDEK